ncbi:MAG: nicotinate-nucleotide adenylyltransferase [Dysgonamonadaceae bacterium]|jgi:nicotinate-nucleotide adenylyltransferase|nr:nicotinate-nucleotide adenylyltransferase [Dysgonamonadaceae bacterium]
MKIGLYPGSFDPIHNGHLAIANYICEFENYDEIWFLITPQNPCKKKVSSLCKEDRLLLIEKSIKGYEKFKTCTIEWEFTMPVYTINTLQRLKIRYPENTFDLIIGTDNWEIFHRWKDYQRILNNFKILVYPRKGITKTTQPRHPNVRFCRTAPQVEISSSFIRKSIRNNKDVRFFMPDGVYDIIREIGCYEAIPEETPKQDEPEKKS